MPSAAIPLDPKNLSLLWASPERADEIAALHARLFDRRGTPRASSA